MTRPREALVSYLSRGQNPDDSPQVFPAAFGVAADGRREVLGFEVGDSENEGFWSAFLRSLKARVLDGVKLVISDAHSGLKKAISTVFQGAAWQRCRLLPETRVIRGVPERRQRPVRGPGQP